MTPGNGSHLVEQEVICKAVCQSCTTSLSVFLLSANMNMYCMFYLLSCEMEKKLPAVDDEEFKYEKRLKRGGLEEVTAAVGPSVSGCIINGCYLQVELRLTLHFLKTREPKAEEKSTHTIIHSY